jgi:hypothetical protein
VKNYVIVILAVFILSQVATSSLILTLSNRAQRRSVVSQNVTEGYLRCIFLARFDYPKAAKPDATREEVLEALDGCSKSNR